MRRRTFPYRPLSIRRLPKKCTTSPNRTLQLPSFGRRPRTRRGHGAASGGDDDAGDRDPLRRAQPLAADEETRERGGRRLEAEQQAHDGRGQIDRKRGVSGKSVSGRVDLGGGRRITQNNSTTKQTI